MHANNQYPQLKQHLLLRRLEEPVLYEPKKDELYTLDNETLNFLTQLGTQQYNNLTQEQKEITQYLHSEELINFTNTPQKPKPKPDQSPIPSLRFLQLNITTRCNLNCHHCNLGKTPRLDMNQHTFLKAARQFEENSGLKLIISGGEPLLHPQIFKYLQHLQKYNYRKVVLTNATLINKKTAEKLSELADEVQISLDGTKQSHEQLRGQDTYQKTLDAIKNLQKTNTSISIATIIHTGNLNEFDKLNNLIQKINPIRWSIDTPCIAGNLKDHPHLLAPLGDAAEIMRNYGFGGALHPGSEDHTCGSHLCEIMPDGNIVRCSFFEDNIMGNLNTGTLSQSWKNVCKQYLWHTSELTCANCSVISECKGGCRYRAYTHQGLLGPDPLQCRIYQVTPPD